MPKKKTLFFGALALLGIAAFSVYNALNKRSQVMIEFFPSEWVEKGYGSGGSFAKDVEICLTYPYSDCATYLSCSPPEGGIYLDVSSIDGPSMQWRTFSRGVEVGSNSVRLMGRDICIQKDSGEPFEFTFEPVTNKEFILSLR
ncbi:hypothetical protein [Sulfitobacter sp. JB4-11]|uniref:hypothetical protein n=1 Tax=Sulfitobacter rhodophyticola TaxID=3238304 RepID=UPI003513FE12